MITILLTCAEVHNVFYICVCVYTYVYICVYTHIFVCIHTDVYIYLYVFVYVFYIHVHTHLIVHPFTERGSKPFGPCS